MLQRLPIALAKVKAGNTSENLLNELRKITYSLHREKEITKKYITILWIQWRYNTKMDTIFMSSKKSKTSDPHTLWLNLTGEIDLRRKDKYIALSNRSMYYTWKNIKKSDKNVKFNILAATQNKEFELPDGWYSILDIWEYFEYTLNNMEKKDC